MPVHREKSRTPQSDVSVGKALKKCDNEIKTGGNTESFQNPSKTWNAFREDIQVVLLKRFLINLVTRLPKTVSRYCMKGRKTRVQASSTKQMGLVSNGMFSRAGSLEPSSMQLYTIIRG